MGNAKGLPQLTVLSNIARSPITDLDSEFLKLLKSYGGSSTDAAFEPWLEQELAGRYLGLPGIPNWLQGAGWPFANGAPLMFAGQIDYLYVRLTFFLNNLLKQIDGIDGLASHVAITR